MDCLVGNRGSRPVARVVGRSRRISGVRLIHSVAQSPGSSSVNFT